MVAVTAGALCLAAGASAQTTEPTASTSADTSGATAGTTSTTSPATKDKAAAKTQNKAASTANQAAHASGGATTGSIGPKDRAFVNTAAKGNLTEVHMGQAAQQQGQSAEVKKLGAVMVTDHTQANNELMVIAHSRGINVDSRHKMDKIDSANFDQAWLAMMIRDHQKTIAEFQTESQTGMDADVKAYATKTLPTLQKHLKLLEKAQRKVGGSGAGSSGTSGASGSSASPSPSASASGKTKKG